MEKKYFIHVRAVSLLWVRNTSENKRLSILYCSGCFQPGSGAKVRGERTFLEHSPRTLTAVEGRMLVQTSSSPHHCSSCPTNSLRHTPGLRQPETHPSSECPVKRPSWRPRQYTFWNCLPLRWYWSPGNCCKFCQRVVAPAPVPAEGSTTNSCIAQRGTAYAPAGHRWTPQPCSVSWDPGNYCILRQRPVPVNNPPRHTTGVYLSTPTASIFIYPCR